MSDVRQSASITAGDVHLTNTHCLLKASWALDVAGDLLHLPSPWHQYSMTSVCSTEQTSQILRPAIARNRDFLSSGDDSLPPELQKENTVKEDIDLVVCTS